MDFNNLFTFIVVATLLVISPGPNGFLIAKTVPLHGKKAGFTNIFGFVAAFYLHGAMAVFGISLLLVQSAKFFFIFKMLGAAYLIWIGLRALLSAFKNKSVLTLNAINRPSSPVSTSSAFFEGFLTNALNPKVSMFYLAAFPQLVSLNESTIDSFKLVTLHSLINFVWFSIMIYTLSRIKVIATSMRFRQWLNSVTGVVLIYFGVKLALIKNG